MNSTVSKEEENFLRIVYLNFRVATGALTRFFNKLHPNLSGDLNIPGNKAILQQLYNPPPGRKRVIFQGQWNILYPPPGSPAVTSADLDLTLIVCLLRNIPPVLAAPVNGFDNLPSLHDISDGANIARLKYYKNFLVSHSKDGTLSNPDFVRIWIELEQAITGIDNSQVTVVNLKDAETKMLDSSVAQLLSIQIQLDTKVSNLQDELEQISIHIEKDVQEKKELKMIADDLDERKTIKRENLELDVKECEENVDRVYARQNTMEEQMNERTEIIGEKLDKLYNLQQLLASQITRIETIVKESEKEKETLVNDVLSLCSQIQDNISKTKERIDALETKSEILQEVQKDVDILKIKSECIEAEIKKQDEDHIPKNIRDCSKPAGISPGGHFIQKTQHRREIREWEQDKTTFVEIRATHHILGLLSLNNCIVVTGTLGCGKSSNIHHAALQLRDSFRYEIIPVLTGPIDIINYYDENKKQVFVVDDICGKETINNQTLQIWRDFADKMKKIFTVREKEVAKTNDGTVLEVSSPKLLISCRLHIYKEPQFQRIALLTQNECNLLSSELCLLQQERMLMLHTYLPDDVIAKVKLKHVLENHNFFPLLCKLSQNKTSEEVDKLFTAPLDRINRNIKNIIKENKEQCCTLALCILFDDGFNTNWLKLRSVQEKKKNKLEDIVKVFDINLSNEMHRNSLKSGFSTLHGTYLKLKDQVYRIIHDKNYKMAAVICGQHLTECFIKYAPSVFIRDHFIFDSIPDINENGNSIVLLKDQEEDYFERLLCDLKESDITSTFRNNQLIYQSFIDKLISFFGRSHDAKSVLKKLDKLGCKIKIDADKHEYLFQTHFYTTPLMEAASRGYPDIVRFLIINLKCNVIDTEKKDMSPLYEASEKGHSGVVKLLLESNANIRYCNRYGQSSLYVACEGGHTDTVQLLLQYNADVSQCEKNRMYPLHVGCKRGYTDIVRMLLQYNADVSQMNNNGDFALHIACKGKHTDIVKLLLQFNANVSQCDSRRESPLYMVCKEDLKDIVILLLQYNVDVNQCNSNEESALYVACKRGHTDLVKLLLQYNADINQGNNHGDSPLYMACEGGLTDKVKLLLQNNANVSKCNSYEESPLYVACKGGHTDIVEMLLQQNADVSKCNSCGESPLYVACTGGYTKIVKRLLQNNADVSTCDRWGDSPLYVACKTGHTDTAELLLQKHADVSQCNSCRESPLYVSCKKGHADLVELLLQYKADILNCNQNDESPLYVACHSGHIHIVELLLKNKADVSQCEQKRGQSPLHVACQKFSFYYLRKDHYWYKDNYTRYIETIKLLLAWNANITLCDSKGQTPLDIAFKSQCMAFVKLFEDNLQLKASQSN